MYKYLTVILLSSLLLCCSPNNVTINNGFEKYFTQLNVKGTFAIYNNGQSNFIIYNLDRFKDSAFAPSATFHIIQSLVGLQTGVISNESKIGFDISDTDSLPKNPVSMSLQDAFKNNSFPYFENLSKQLGQKTQQFWIDSLKYGNKQLGNSIDSFWFNNKLKITPDEQMGLVEKVYFNQLPFQKRVQTIVKKLMIKQNNANYQLAYITGNSILTNNHHQNWIVGWVEENKHPYFFVLNTEGEKESDSDSLQSGIVNPILKELGFFEGKK